MYVGHHDHAEVHITVLANILGLPYPTPALCNIK